MTRNAPIPIDLVNWGIEVSKSFCGACWNLEKHRFSYIILFLWECYCSCKQQCISSMRMITWLISHGTCGY